MNLNRNFMNENTSLSDSIFGLDKIEVSEIEYGNNVCNILVICKKNNSIGNEIIGKAFIAKVSHVLFKMLTTRKYLNIFA